MIETQDRFTIEVPADPAYVGAARIFSSSLARHYGLEEDTVEDLKLAISEACSRALAAEGAERIEVRIERVDGRLRFEVPQGDLVAPADDTATPTPSSAEMAAGFSLELVGALFEDAAVVEGPEGAQVLRFSVA